MQTVRRLYLYLLSGISLGVLLVGLNLLLTVVLGAIGFGRGTFVGGSGAADREQLSLAAALVVVGLLVWGGHWWFVERSLRSDRRTAAEERGSALRALYLSLVLAILLAFGSLAGLTLLHALLAAFLGASSTDADLAGASATLLVTGSAWLYHVWVRRRDLEVPVTGAGAWLPRVYVYGAALAGLILLALSLGRLLGAALDQLIGPAAAVDSIGRFAVAGEAAGFLVWSAIWLGHWWYASRLAGDPGWRGASERPARLRLAYFVAVIGASAVAVLWFTAEALRAVLVSLLGAEGIAGVSPTPGSLAVAVGGSMLAALPWALAWWIHRAWMRAESLERDELGRVATVDRLDAGVVALAGLGFAAIGLGWLLGLAIDVTLGGNRAAGEFWRLELAQFVSVAAVGVAPWIWNWARLQRRSAQDPAAEAASTVRRSILLVILATAVLTSLGSLAFVLYRLFGTLLGVGFGGNAVSDLSTPVGSLLVAAATAAYHGVVLRRDQRLREEAIPPAGEPAPAPSGVLRTLLLTGPIGADLDATVSSLRAQLPPGFGLESPEAAPD